MGRGHFFRGCSSWRVELITLLCLMSRSRTIGFMSSSSIRLCNVFFKYAHKHSTFFVMTKNDLLLTSLLICVGDSLLAEAGSV